MELAIALFKRGRLPLAPVARLAETDQLGFEHAMASREISPRHNPEDLKENLIVHRDMDFMIGSWVEDPLFDEALRAQRQCPPATM